MFEKIFDLSLTKHLAEIDELMFLTNFEYVQTSENE